ncbi:septal ring lytic transglycosylase RlpA family protein [Calothrix rhizosoleniae]|uniref:septal ring lytic transglycosylase RlpA family protein n=1 Tax=Calothrix rhizosoleniae TaxID=888997 RepID=UPI000B498CAF|nr:septal ring lytic transglycosylase RlpA family protein [Calothrix rhizosoleniae]
MNQKKLWITVALSTAVLGIPSTVNAQTTGGKVDSSPSLPSGDVVKVGEFQSPAATLFQKNVITKVHTHNLEGRQAATLFVHNIPVITFLGSESAASAETKLGTIGKFNSADLLALKNNKSIKIAGNGNIKGIINQDLSTSNDPVSRAGALAAKLDQLAKTGVDASKINVSWKGNTNKSVSPENALSEAYVIKVNDAELVEINDNTRLPDTTKDLGQDALQATNRLRRLIGKASPLKEIANLPDVSNLTPDSSEQILIAHHTTGYRRRRRRSLRSRVGGIFRGLASFYGYDGSSNKTASGERFHPEKMTAAHRSLPFGTKVRVTNPSNGRSVVVRINDRGPFIRGRVIDLSYGAARVLGIIRRGVAPVKIKVLGR